MSGSFGDLLKRAGLRPSEAAEPAPEAPDDAEAETPADPALPRKVAVRFGKKAGTGRKATRISGIAAGQAELLARLQAALGVGGTVEDDGEIALRGDQVDRAARWFEAQGVTVRR